MLVTLILLSSLIYFLLDLWKNKKSSNVKWSSSPPGPRGLPLVGNLPAMVVNQVNRTFAKWADEYGPIYSIWLGPYPAIVLADAQIIRKAFSLDAFSGRPQIPMFDHIDGTKRGLIMNHGKRLVEQRNFAVKTLMKLSTDGGKYEANIQQEVTKLLEILKTQSGQTICLQHKFSAPVLNTLWERLMGAKFKHDDQKLHTLVQLTSRVAGNYESMQMITMAFPLLGKIFPELSRMNKVSKALKEMGDVFADWIQERSKTRIKNEPRDFTDAYLDKVDETTDLRSSFHLTQTQQVRTTIDVFGAGVETTGGTLEWFLLLMARYPNIQQKVQQEIDLIIPNSRQPFLSDRPQLPITESALCETLRFVNLTPIGIPHMTLKDVEIEGYKIPKYTTVFSSQYTLHKDKKVWRDSNNFRPERFLEPDQDGRILWKTKNFLPFSVGQRVCIGANFAKDSLLLFAAGILQKFSIRFGGNENEEENFANFDRQLERKMSLVALPSPIMVIFTERS